MLTSGPCLFRDGVLHAAAVVGPSPKGTRSDVCEPCRLDRSAICLLCGRGTPARSDTVSVSKYLHFELDALPLHRVHAGSLRMAYSCTCTTASKPSCETSPIEALQPETLIRVSSQFAFVLGTPTWSRKPYVCLRYTGMCPQGCQQLPLSAFRLAGH